MTDQVIHPAQAGPETENSLRDAISGLSTIYCYAVGFTIEEQAVYPRPSERNAQYDLAKRAERIEPEKFPLVLAAGEEVFTEFDERFERGLQVIISGLQAERNRTTEIEE